VVQATIADALASQAAPGDEEGFRRFVYVIARNKVADHYRRHSRELLDDEIDDAPGSQDAVSARDLLRWAQESLPSSEDKSTLEWMLREADGDKLEHIAREENVPAPRVRQRVSRLRKYLRARWAAQLAAAGVAGLLVVLGVVWLQRPQKVEIESEKDKLIEDGQRLRRAALERCRAERFRECLEGLDRASRLDPQGDRSEAVRDARKAAAEALAPKPELPEPTPAPAPSQSAPVPAPSATAPPRQKLAPTPVAPQGKNIDSMPETPPQQMAVPKTVVPKGKPRLNDNFAPQQGLPEKK
jgi:hypothetical protein